ncbi:hypothetical protein HELRODRAFT_175478 [Helobdella robusta]|uniref:Uncharacterized protein n=1 Tax=Helobdella robusta TaxID=6412 RepID=T1F9A7_HELRO|nr:hypothetical protein HELRODRAFT_175478 [Helobdella robusta]ESO00976.1 hypothetical protein HELRODRAFT_175478 [Helobdella robusta]
MRLMEGANYDPRAPCSQWGLVRQKKSRQPDIKTKKEAINLKKKIHPRRKFKKENYTNKDYEESEDEPDGFDEEGDNVLVQFIAGNMMQSSCMSADDESNVEDQQAGYSKE